MISRRENIASSPQTPHDTFGVPIVASVGNIVLHSLEVVIAYDAAVLHVIEARLDAKYKGSTNVLVEDGEVQWPATEKCGPCSFVFTIQVAIEGQQSRT